MKSRFNDPRLLRVAEFAGAGQTLVGQAGAADMPRLASYDVAEEVGVPSPPVRWSVRGEQQHGSADSLKTYLQVEAEVALHMRCERCLRPVPQSLNVRRRIRFVRDEDTAAQLDAHDDEEDVLALTPVLDVIELIEEELILSLPLAPRHEDCAMPAPVGSGGLAPPTGGADTHRPFEMLAALKTPKKST